MKYLLSSVAIVAALALAAPVWAQGYGPGPGARTGTGPGVTPPGGARSLLAAAKSTGGGGTGVRAPAVGNALSRGGGSWDGSWTWGYNIGGAADAPACAGFNAPPWNGGTSSVVDDRRHRRATEPGRVCPRGGG